jgi:hypothetical protein
MTTDDSPQQDRAETSLSLRQALTDALGLPAETFLIEVLLGETTPPVIRCHYYPTPEAVLRAVVLFSEYHLVAKPPPLPEPPAPAAPPTPEGETGEQR